MTERTQSGVERQRFLGGEILIVKLLDLMEGFVVGALEGFDAAVQAGEGLQVALVGCAETGNFGGERLLPEAGFDGLQSAELPLGTGEGIDEKALERRSGRKLAMVAGNEFFELDGVFTRDDLRFGLNAGLQGIETGCGLALNGARSGGTKRVLPVGENLGLRSHKIVRAYSNP